MVVRAGHPQKCLAIKAARHLHGQKCLALAAYTIPTTMAPPALTLASIAVYPRTPRDDARFTGSARTSAFVLPGTPGAQLFPRTPGAQLFPRTPRTARPPAEYSPVSADQDEDVGGEEDDALLAAAAEEERLLPPGDLSWEEKRGMALLALLCALRMDVTCVRR
jgi:hypothetical protein